jgi:pimeloyl-ACP methyl ester carboxylesterase
MPDRRVAALASLLALLGCSSSDPTGPSGPTGPSDDLAATCNPLRQNEVCLLPYPSAIFLDADSSTQTGFRVHLGKEMFPRSSMGKTYDPVRMNLADGFSPTGEILAYFPDRLDQASLPALDDVSTSLDPESATVIVDMDLGTRVAHLSEVDQQVFSESDRQALILRPAARLRGGGRYAVAVTRKVRTLAGKVPASPPGWEAIVKQTASDPLAKKQSERMPAIVKALAEVGVREDELVLAWDFLVQSDASLTRSMRSMRATTLEALKDGPLGYTITSVEDDFGARTLRRIRGTFKTPKFLSQTDIKVPEATLSFDGEGNPIVEGSYDAPFTLILPRAATKGPVKLVLFGHGFLGSGEGELGGAEGSYLQDLADEKGLAFIATDWIGLSRYEGYDNKGSQAAALALQDLNLAPWIGDRLHQSLVNAMTLARTARDAIAHDPALFVDGKAVIDTTRIDYLGISLGGVMGSALMGYSPDLERGVLNVGAAGWSNLFHRSLNWALFKLVVDGAYPDKLDQQVLLEVLQAHFDPVDGMSIAPQVLDAPLEGNPKKHLLLQMAVNDLQVPNLASEIYARSVGLPLLSDAPLDVALMSKKSGPLPSALTAFDLHQEAPPPGNVPATVTSPNHVHTELRSLPAVEDQLDHFLRTGEVISTCEGTCDPE